MALPIVRSSAQTLQAAASTNWVGNMPASVVAGDLLVAFVAVAGTKASGVPAGWSELVTVGQTGHSLTVYTRESTGSGAASYTWVGGSRSPVITILALDGATAAGLIFSSFVGASRTTANGFPAPALTTASSDNLLVTAVEAGSTATPWTPPAGYTELHDAASPGATPCSSAVAVKGQPTAGDSGSALWLPAATTTGQSILLSIPSTTSNTAPLVDAGPHQNVHEGELVTLAAVESDVEGGATGTWTQVLGPVVTLSSAAATATFTAPLRAGLLVFRRTVTDPGGLTATDWVSVAVWPVDELVWDGSAWT